MERLTDLPDVGPKLAGHLTRAGILTPEQLREAGAKPHSFKSVPKWMPPPACMSWKRWQALWRACGKISSLQSGRRH